VDRIARRVGVAQPYVFSLFASKRELFLAAVERGFELVAETFSEAAAAFDPAGAAPDTDVLTAMGSAYIRLLSVQRDYLLLQLQGYAACDDDVIREQVRHSYARLVAHVERLSGASPERLDEFFRHGMWLNVAAAMGVGDLSCGAAWMRAELARTVSARS
jgi:AcrR family transcriptional regulator